jgi:thymidylate synthase ThyX
MQKPFQTVTKLTKGYSGEFSNVDRTPEEIELAFKDLNSTQLRTPFEMIYNVFLFTDFTRSFTHQLVRKRFASYVQESMRFIGHKKLYKVLAGSRLIENDKAFELYRDSCINDIITYESLMDLGIAGEEARDSLPHGILTSAFVGIPLNSLQGMYAQRMCCQAQPGQWQNAMRQVKNQLVIQYGESAKLLLSAPYERGEPCGYRASFDRPCTWQKNES